MKSIQKKTSLVLIIIATVLLLFSSFAFWLNRYIFDPQNFKAVATEAILEESSREALAGEVVDQALGSNPLLKEAIGGRLEGIVASLLDSGVSRTLFEEVSLVIQKQITTPDHEEVSIDMTVMKGFLDSLSGAVSPDDPESLRVDDVPDEIVIVRKSEIPSISGFGKAVFWIWPWAFLSGLAFLAYVFYFAADRGWALKVAGVSLIIGGVVVAILPYLLSPAVFASTSDENIRIILESIYYAFAAKILLVELIPVSFGILFLFLGYKKLKARL